MMMKSLSKTVTAAFVVMALALVAVVPAAAQAAPADTVTVTGTGYALGEPTEATIDLGVEVFNTSVKEAFNQSNNTIRAIYDALLAVGIEEKDIQTSNLSVYTTTQYSMERGTEQSGYQVSNTVRVTIRDIANVTAVIDAAIGAGATSMYGLSFGITDTTALETTARAAAFEQARARAAELAALSGATLGDVVSITEGYGGGVAPFYGMADMAGRGGGGAFVATGQNEVSVSLQVTFKLVR